MVAALNQLDKAMALITSLPSFVPSSFDGLSWSKIIRAIACESCRFAHGTSSFRALQAGDDTVALYATITFGLGTNVDHPGLACLPARCLPLSLAKLAVTSRSLFLNSMKSVSVDAV